jgi:pimeloyl-ACP methyl ester carboxylesterase
MNPAKQRLRKRLVRRVREWKVRTKPLPSDPRKLVLLRDERYTEIRGHRLRTSVEGNGPPLLLINGLAANIELWQPLRAQLPGRQTIAFDAPGVGGSPPAPRRLRMDDLADIVEGLLNELPHDVVDVLGYSFGGAVAQAFARRHPGRVRRLVLAATTPGLGGIQSPKTLAELALLAVRRDLPARSRAVARVVGGRVAEDRALQAWVERAHRAQPISRAGIAQQLLTMAGWTSLPWLHTITAPTLVLVGAEDPLVPPVNARIFMSRMPSCHWYLVPRAGHLFLIDRAPDAAAVIESFLADERSLERKHRAFSSPDARADLMPRALRRVRRRSN